MLSAIFCKIISQTCFIFRYKALQSASDKERFPFTKKFGKFLLGFSVWEERLLFATSSIRRSRGTPGRFKDRKRYGTGDKNNKYEKSVNGTQIFHWKIPNGKTGLHLQKFLFFRTFSSGTNRKIMFHLQPNRNFRNLLVNGKRPKCVKKERDKG